MIDCFHLQVWLPWEHSKFPDEPTEYIGYESVWFKKSAGVFIQNILKPILKIKK